MHAFNKMGAIYVLKLFCQSIYPDGRFSRSWFRSHAGIDNFLLSSICFNIIMRDWVACLSRQIIFYSCSCGVYHTGVLLLVQHFCENLGASGNN